MSSSLYPSFTNGTTALCPFNDDTPGLFERWFSDQSLVVLMGDWEFYPLPHYGQTPAEYSQRTRKTTWLVCDLSQQEPLPVGYTGLYLQPRHKVGIYRVAIAEAAYRGKGHGYRTTLMALEWAFKYLDLFSLHASLAASNKPSIGLHLKCGFRECGRYTLSRSEPSGRTDEIQMEILQSQWVSFCDGQHASDPLSKDKSSSRDENRQSRA